MYENYLKKRNFKNSGANILQTKATEPLQKQNQTADCRFGYLNKVLPS